MKIYPVSSVGIKDVQHLKAEKFNKILDGNRGFMIILSEMKNLMKESKNILKIIRQIGISVNYLICRIRLIMQTLDESRIYIIKIIPPPIHY